MAIKGKHIAIRRSELHTVEDTVAAWEVDILEATHTDGAIKVLKDVVIAHRELPDAKEEFERLESRYKLAVNEDGSKGIAVVATVYGQHAAGIQALRRAIESARVDEDSLV